MTTCYHVGDKCHISDDDIEWKTRRKRQKTESSLSNFVDFKQSNEDGIWKLHDYQFMHTIRRSESDLKRSIGEENEKLKREAKLLRKPRDENSVEVIKHDEVVTKEVTQKEWSRQSYTLEEKALLKSILPDIRKHVEYPWKKNGQKMEQKLESKRMQNEDLRQEVEYWKKKIQTGIKEEYLVIDMTKKSNVEIKHQKAAPVRPRKGDRGYTREQKELLKRILPDIRKYVETPWKEDEQNLKRKLESERIRNEDLKREIEYWMAWATDSNYYRC